MLCCLSERQSAGLDWAPGGNDKLLEDNSSPGGDIDGDEADPGGSTLDSRPWRSEAGSVPHHEL
jgi:hypothetical protein